MGRPLKDTTGITPEWRMTTVRVPRWLADRVRDRARGEGFEESWEALLELPDLPIPTPLPSRFRHHGPLPGGLIIRGVDLAAIAEELDRLGVAYRLDDGVLRMPIQPHPRTPAEYDDALQRFRAFREVVRAATASVGAEGVIVAAAS